MVKKNSIIKRTFSMIFVLILLIGFIRSNSYAKIQRLFDYLGQDKTTEEPLTVDAIENEFVSTLYMKKDLINLNGSMARELGMQGFYSDMGMYVIDDNYIVSASAYTSTDYEYVETVAFRDFLESNGINFLYVNEPTKYVDDNLFYKEFGIESYSNRNMDLFLSRVRDAGVNTVDIRDNIASENINVRDLFYRTDHHWTVPAGLWATKIMVQALNDDCGYDIDLSIYDDKNFDTTEWKECWLGEQGRKVAETYVGLDDYTEVKPNFETSYTFINGDGTTWEGTFNDFINESVYNTENDVYENSSWYYSYNRIHCINNNVENGKILILGDSYDHVTQPFLSLGIHEVDSLILRGYDDSFSLRNYILENGYDTVIVAYAQFMVGAHDNEGSANYRMFTFEY